MEVCRASAKSCIDTTVLTKGTVHQMAMHSDLQLQNHNTDAC